MGGRSLETFARMDADKEERTLSMLIALRESSPTTLARKLSSYSVGQLEDMLEFLQFDDRAITQGLQNALEQPVQSALLFKKNTIKSVRKALRWLRAFGIIIS